MNSLHGSQEYYQLLEEMKELHNRKSHDYASNSNPFGNYIYAGECAALFKHSPRDAGFYGRISEKIYRLANLETDGKKPNNESIEDTERDIAVITLLWMAYRRENARKSFRCGSSRIKIRKRITRIRCKRPNSSNS